MQTDPTISLAMDLIRCRSVTPDDAGCQVILAKRLGVIGFNNEQMRFGDVDNLWARKGTKSPVFCFAGHTDVVPSGPENLWAQPPFEPGIKDGVLFGRGAADMKGALAAFVIASERFVKEHPDHKGSIACLITSDEEGPSVDGTVKVIDCLQKRDEFIDYCLVGEPSSTDRVGDVIKIGRRGSLGARLTVKGKQGHVAFPHLASNPIHLVAPALEALTSEQWDKGNAQFPPTGFQISNIQAGVGVTNVIPGECEVVFNLRFSTEVTADSLKKRIETLLDRHNLSYDIDWTLNGLPFLTEKTELIQAVCDAIFDVTGKQTTQSTSGGTSDGRFIAPAGVQVVELGVCNASIHQVDESAKVDDLQQLTLIYQRILERLLL